MNISFETKEGAGIIVIDKTESSAEDLRLLHHF